MSTEVFTVNPKNPTILMSKTASTNPKVDAYLKNAKRWREEMEMLRT